MQITINFSELRFTFCLWQPKSIKKYFQATSFKVEEKSRTFQGHAQKFKDLSKKNGIQGLFKTVWPLMFLRSHFAVKQIVESQNVGPFLRLILHLLNELLNGNEQGRNRRRIAWIAMLLRCLITNLWIMLLKSIKSWCISSYCPLQAKKSNLLLLSFLGPQQITKLI